jgi:2-hydroxychromene-2-carboxylate isomerase
MSSDTPADWYFDILSPFAYLQAARFGELPAALAIRPKPVLLGAILSHWKLVGPAEIATKRRHTYRMCAWSARQRGLPFRMPPRHPFNPLPALRILAGAEPDVAMAVRALSFVFAEGRAPDTEAELAAFAGALGVSGDAAELAASQVAKDRLRANTEEAIGHGVFGVPSFHLDGEIFWGDDATGLFAAFLADRDMFEAEPWRHLESIEVGVERRKG